MIAESIFFFELSMLFSPLFLLDVLKRFNRQLPKTHRKHLFLFSFHYIYVVKCHFVYKKIEIIKKFFLRVKKYRKIGKHLL